MKSIYNSSLYLISCINFAKQTQEWISLEEKKFYTTTNPLHGWEETCDNSHCGLSVKWAFHKTESEIRNLYLEEFAKEINYYLNAFADNELDYELEIRS